jgi:general secretion pathway protein L
MSETLIVRFNARDERVEWVVVDQAGGVSASTRGALAEAAPLAENRRLMAVAPANSVLRVTANIPLKGATKIRQALPFALEEQLAGDIDAQHFAFSKPDSNRNIPVAVVERPLMRHWLERLETAGLRADSFRVESDGVPSVPATVNLLIEDETAIIRDHLGAYLVTDTGSLQIVLEMLLDQHSDTMENDATVVPVNVIAYCDEATHARFSDMWERLRMRAENVDVKILTDGALPFLAAQLAGSEGINLLQGDYAPKSDINFEWEPWRLPAALLAGCLLLTLAIKGLQFWQLTTTEAALDAAATQVLQQTFPDAGETGDPWNALQSRLGTATSTTVTASGPGFGKTISVLADAFAATPALRMQTMVFRAGVLDLQLLAPDVSSLDKLRQQIAESGAFDATIQSANPDKDVIKGRLQIKAVSE